jgi:isoleucyl-tRNA synthetase
MSKAYPEYKELNLAERQAEIQQDWKEKKTFAQSIRGSDSPSFTFFEGPPSANGMPGIHHVLSRAIKDSICRYKSLQGFRVERKAGWDTHGLPVELQVEKELGITKEDIGKSISIEAYNAACRKSVMKFTGSWQELTELMGYWVDMDNPYVTYQTKYMETVWWILKHFYDQGLIYKGYTIQPFSPAAGTGLSSHELNQPGTYKMVSDTTIVAQFLFEPGQSVAGESLPERTFGLAWTTTPWTLPSNTALGVGPNIEYVLVKTLNPYTREAQYVILAEARLQSYFDADWNKAWDKAEDKSRKVPWEVLRSFTGKELQGLRYQQLMPYAQPEEGKAFQVISGDFVTTEDGTGMVHLAPSFGADDFKTAKEHGIGALTLVDRRGRFTQEVSDFAGEYVKEAYLTEEEKAQGYESVDVRIAVKLKQEGKAFKIEKYEHTYPHCWRTDKPILYYPLDSWFVRTTAMKERLLELNKEINWRPPSTGTGRFGQWLENLQDWNLSRSRYWGIPLPIWRSKDGKEERCIGAVSELLEAIEASVQAGIMDKNPYGNLKDSPDYASIDLHRPFVDEVVLVSPTGQAMYREPDLIDVWFDSGSMPFAQWHYPFENKEKIEQGSAFPADFIAEGVDQTRGWFFTLHVIAAGIMDSVAYKSVISNGLVLDKHGQKMSKRLGNAVDPFQTMQKFGADATRWYMLTNAAPWDNLKFDEQGIEEVRRRFFGTLYNTYAFFALYANLDGWSKSTPEMPKIPAQLDAWILSRLEGLKQEVTQAYEAYDLTLAGRLIQDFVTESLSNWYVRLSRKRFWVGSITDDKDAAFSTLHWCLDTVARLMAPLAPFYADRLYRDLRPGSTSVHLSHWPQLGLAKRDESLEAAMDLAQRATSLVLSLRKKQRIRVRQPLRKVLVPVMDARQKELLEQVMPLFLNEVNVKQLEFLTDIGELLVLKAKPDFKKLGPRFGADMKWVNQRIQSLSQSQIQELRTTGALNLELEEGRTESINLDEVEVVSEDVPGWQVAVDGDLTVALDIALDQELKAEGMARDFVNRVQNLRKDLGLEVGQRIRVYVHAAQQVQDALRLNKAYICAEVLAAELYDYAKEDSYSTVHTLELEDEFKADVQIEPLL